MAPRITYPQLHDQAWMQEHYVDEQLTIYEIAAQLGCSEEAVFLALRRNGIKGRTKKQQRRVANFKPKACRGCGDTFQPRSTCHLYCPECRPPRPDGKKSKRKPVPRRICAWCSEPFRSRSQKWRYYSRQFCSPGHKAEFLQHHEATSRRRVNENGYAEIRVGVGYPGATAGGYMLEHRYVMERLIGRSLYRHETVHHKYGQRADNRPEQLELWSTSQPSGQRVEDKISWALEFLAQYGTVNFELTTRQVELRG